MDEAKTVTLKYPVEMTATNGEKTMLTVVTPRRAKARDLRNLPAGALTDYQGNENAMAPVMIALCCGIPLETAEELDIEDVFAIMAELPNFMPAVSGIGGKSSGESPESTTSLPT